MPSSLLTSLPPYYATNLLVFATYRDQLGELELEWYSNGQCPSTTNVTLHMWKQKGESQLRETQLVQIVFNTLMFQLGTLSLLAWRFTDFETALTGPMIFAAGTLAALASAVFTLLCKGVFRWGNTRRRKARKASRLHRLKQWARSAAKERAASGWLL